MNGDGFDECSTNADCRGNPPPPPPPPPVSSSRTSSANPPSSSSASSSRTSSRASSTSSSSSSRTSSTSSRSSVSSIRSSFGSSYSVTYSTAYSTSYTYSNSYDYPTTTGSYPYCGDAIVQRREQCDRGSQNGQIGSTCSITCQITVLPSCGNGIIQQGEECDDGNVRDGDGCTFLCRREGKYCPDGTLCRDGTCQSGKACTQSSCGDGIVQTALNEQCDDANRINNDDCDNVCHWTVLPECGDGVVQSEFELCDNGSDPTDANRNSDAPNSECRLNCVLQRCGDGIVDSFIEECDDGNNLNGDDCSAVCTLESGAAPDILGSLLPPSTIGSVPGQNQSFDPTTIPTPARTPTGPGLVIFLASGAAAGVGLARRRFLERK